ncbi:hypothetical protein SCLCIDRAFT_1216175 [Scleroderma citrinum Foug A]|uniref:Uncharacterized protein n=1 Tax=Scleroderma citrinum Foug A TaxID=1036808 RepID=A0A0C3DYH3_9AGAM|nr:hypothetical protein SCLCIDRAFT_1216175 [Scleroderma citrinum Foug A]
MSNVHTGMHSIANETETPPDEVETVRRSRNEQKRPNSPDRAARGRPDKPNGCKNHADRSSVYMDMPSAGYNVEMAKDEAETIRTTRMLNMRTRAITPANEEGNISTLPNEPKTRNSPSGGAKQRSHELNGFGDTTNPSSGCRDSHSIGNDTGTAANEMEIVRTCRNGAKSQNSPNGCKIATPWSTCRQRRVSIDVINIYILLNVLIAVPSRKFVFGRVEGGDERMARESLKRRLATVKATETEATGTWTARLAAVAATRYKSKQRSWLQRVSIYATAEERKTRTYLCCPGHPPIVQNVQSDSLNVDVDAIASKSNLQRSIQRRPSRMRTRRGAMRKPSEMFLWSC